MNDNLPRRISDLILSRCDATGPHLVDGRPLVTAEADAICEELRRRGIYAGVIDAEDISDEEVLFDALATTFAFPDYFGRNWNAVDECLIDLSSWLPAEGYCCVIISAESLKERIPHS